MTRCTACGKVIPEDEVELIEGMSYCKDCKVMLNLNEVADEDEDLEELDDSENDSEEVYDEEDGLDEPLIMKPTDDFEVEPIIIAPSDEPEPEPEIERIGSAPVVDSEPEIERIGSTTSDEPEPEPEPVEGPEPEPIVIPQPMIEDEPPQKKRFGLKLERRRPRDRPKREPRKKKEREYEEVVADPDSFKARWDRAMLMAFHNHVILRTLSRDATTGEVIRVSELIPYSELPESAVPCTGEKKVYCVDTIKDSDWYMETHSDLGMDCYEAQFKASDAWLFMQSNKLDNALTVNWTDFNHIDIKKYIMLAGIAIGVLVLFMMLR